MHNSSIIYMLLAVISIALSSFFAKLSLSSVSVPLTVLSRFFVPLTVITAFIFIVRPPIKFSLATLKLDLIRSISLITSQFFLFLSMKQLTLSEASVLYNTGPLFIIIFSFFMGYQINRRDFAGVILGIFGVLLICHIQLFIVNKYVIYGLLSGVAFAISQVTLFVSSKNQNNLNIMFFLYFFASVFSFILLLFFDQQTVQKSDFWNYSLLVSLALLGLFSLSNQFFRGLAYREAENPTSLTSFIYLSVLISFVLDIFWFQVIPDIESILGSILIILGSFVTSTKRFSIKQKKEINYV